MPQCDYCGPMDLWLPLKTISALCKVAARQVLSSAKNCGFSCSLAYSGEWLASWFWFRMRPDDLAFVWWLRLSSYFLPSVERTNALQSSMGIDCCWILLLFVYVSDERWIKPVTSPPINWYRLISKREDLWPTRLLLYPFASFYLSKSSMREDSINTEIHVCTSQEMLLYSN